MVETKEFVVLLETVLDKIRFYHLEEIPVEPSVYGKVNELFDAIPDLIDEDVPDNFSDEVALRKRS